MLVQDYEHKTQDDISFLKYGSAMLFFLLPW